jgi:hypothetical protein
MSLVVLGIILIVVWFMLHIRYQIVLMDVVQEPNTAYVQLLKAQILLQDIAIVLYATVLIGCGVLHLY